jgi:hypothetical protein
MFNKNELTVTTLKRNIDDNIFKLLWFADGPYKNYQQSKDVFEFA